MTNRQYAQTNSARATLKVLHEGDDIIGAFEGIVEVADKAEDKLLEIDELVEEQQRDLTGVTENKESSRLALVAAVMPRSAVRSWPWAKGLAMPTCASGPRLRKAIGYASRKPNSRIAAAGILALGREREDQLGQIWKKIAQNLSKLEAQIEAFKGCLGATARDVIDRRRTTTTMIGSGVRAMAQNLRATSWIP